jgi:hypothetical protein
MPETSSCSALCRPKTFSMAKLISPTVALARAAPIDNSRRFPFPVRAHSVSASSADETFAGSRCDLSSASRFACACRTTELSTLRTFIASCLSRTYLFNPTMTWAPESIRACVRAEASWIRFLGKPSSIALAMPPACSHSTT